MNLTALAMRALLLALGVAASVTTASAQGVETGFVNRSVSMDGAEFRYQVYLPSGFNQSMSWPVILALHGGGGYGNDGLLQTEGGLAKAIHLRADRFPAVVIFPQSHADGTPGWQAAGGRAALLALDKSLVEFNGDRSRVYLTGASAGENGTWYLASQYPERFAALVVDDSSAVVRRTTSTSRL